MEPLNGDDPPKGANEAPQQRQNTVGPALEDGNLASSPLDPPLQDGYIASSLLAPPQQGGNLAPSSLNSPPQGGNAAPSPASMTFPNCGHVIAGDLYHDFLTKPNSDCPVCQQGPFQSVIKFGSHEHIIHGDPLRREFKSSPCQCPVCLPPGDKDVATTNAHSTPTNPTPTNPTPTAVHMDRSRVTLNKYQDPFTFEGVTGEMYTGKDGRPRLRVDEKVWRSWSNYQKDRFVYSTNIRLDQAVGESRQAPTNPGNPNHPGYKPTSTVSVLRRNLKGKPDPDKVAAAIRKLLATPDEDVLAGKSSRALLD